MKQEILFSDNHLLVTIKPAGIPTQRTNEQIGWEDLCKEHLSKELSKKTIFLQTIHRLDKPVSGIVVFARSSKALSRLQEMIRQKKMKKEYTAFIEPGLSPSESKLEHYLVHDDYRARVSTSQDKESKCASLLYHIIESGKKFSKVKIDLITGRYHQIRAQFADIGFPIWGDQKYGSTKKLNSGQIALFHTALSFEHPVTREKLYFTYKEPILFIEN